MPWELRYGDCLEVMQQMDESSVDAIVTDPPYGLRFMGKKWDYDVPSVDIWREALRVLKPGGHLLAFAGTRTQHRMCCNIEDAGFEIRDMLAWVYGTGFPKSLDVSKAIDKAAGHWGGKAGPPHDNDSLRAFGQHYKPTDKGDPITPNALRWQGWGTALKPALEPITLARKPLDGTVAANVLEHGTGGINVNGCRVGDEEIISRSGLGNNRLLNDDEWKGIGKTPQPTRNQGRFPSNLLHDGSPESMHALTIEGSRFFYCAKATKADRDEGLGHLHRRTAGECTARTDGTDGLHSPRAGAGRTNGMRNHHSTVKPTDLMRWLVRLITPLDGFVLDPFCGSGSTGKAALFEGFNFIGIEREAEYLPIINGRLTHAENNAESYLV